MLIDCDQHILLPRIHIHPPATPPPPVLGSKRAMNLFARLAFPDPLKPVFQGRRQRRWCGRSRTLLGTHLREAIQAVPETEEREAPADENCKQETRTPAGSRRRYHGAPFGAAQFSPGAGPPGTRPGLSATGNVSRGQRALWRSFGSFRGSVGLFCVEQVF